MSDLAVGLWSFPALLGLIFLRVPIGLAMFVSGLAGLMVVGGGPIVALARLKSETFTTFSSYSLSIVPMFLLMGHFATLGGMSQSLFKAAESLLGHRRDGVAMAAIGACAGFGSICGSSLATAATMGRVALPELRAYGYARGFSTATLAAGGTLGILIPPSVVLVIYAILTEQNISKLFLAAFIPGTLPRACGRADQSLAGFGGVPYGSRRDLRRCFHANRRGRGGRLWYRANRVACRWLNPRHTGRQLFRYRQIHRHDFFHRARGCILQRVFGTDSSATRNRCLGGRARVQPMGRADLGVLPAARLFDGQPVNDFANNPDFLAGGPRA